MFKKIDITANFGDLELFKGPLERNTKTFYEYSVDTQHILKVLDPIIKFDIMPDDINLSEIIYPGSKPHTDKWKTAINFYFDAQDDETRFFQRKNDESLRTHGYTKGHDLNDLNIISSLVAKTGDVYLMDVRIIHQVTLASPTSTRKIVRLLWNNITFNDLTYKIL